MGKWAGEWKDRPRPLLRDAGGLDQGISCEEGDGKK